MAQGTLQESAAFAAKLIKKNPDISMAEVQKAAKPKGIRIYPRAMGEAKVSLGMGRKKAKRKAAKRKTTKRKATKRGPGRPRKKTAARRGPGRPRGSKTRRRGPGRPRKAAGSPAATLDQVAAHMRELEREVVTLRSRLEKIAGLASSI